MEPVSTSNPDLDFEVTELRALSHAATTIHRGTMDNCDVTYQALLAWIDANGYDAVGYGRELDIGCGPDGSSITELQVELVDKNPSS